MKRGLRALSLLLCLFLLAGCGEEKQAETAGETDRLTMYVGLGNSNHAYCDALHQAILEETGIDVRFVYSSTIDTTTAMDHKIAAYDLPADIICTAQKTDETAQAGAFLDLAGYTNIPELFATTKVREVSVDGKVYQLPFTTRLIGIGYNKTLFEEMGWSLPNTMADMIALKKKAEEAGYPFAVAGGVATGHGFNYLFHLMGGQYLITPDGSAWLDDFLAGKTDVTAFAAQAGYFTAYAEAGLFGDLYTQDWNSKTAFSETRALFYYNITNDIYSYDGFRYNADGTLWGAAVDENGNVVSQEDENGNAVFINGEYVLYDEKNEAHAGLTRYTVPGAVELHDEYGAMPWITRDGANNCFTTYDCMFLALDKKLGDKGQEEKLAQAVKVLEFMTTEKATKIYTDLYSDGYVAVNTFEIDDTRTYAAYADRIKAGYIAEWYYMYFDNDTIVNVGGMVNEMLAGGDVTMTAVLDELESRVTRMVNHTPEVLATVTETLGYADAARLQAIAGAQTLDASLAAAGVEENVTASLVPYIEQPTDIPTLTILGVAQEKLYAGDLLASGVSTLVNARSKSPVAIRMTGKELRQIAEEGFKTSEADGFDHTFSYVCLIKGGQDIDDGAEYLVAVAPEALTDEVYQAYLDKGSIVTVDGKAVTGNVTDGILAFATEHTTISPDTLVW